MAEPLTVRSITAGAYALIIRCGKTVRDLRAIALRYQETGRVLSSMAQELSQELAMVQYAWDSVHCMLHQWECQGAVDQDILLQLSQTLQYGRSILCTLDNDLASCLTGSTSTEEHGFRQRTKVVWNAKRLRNNQDRIRGQMISMNLLISILNL